MTYVRAKMRLASKEYARKRRELNRRVLASNPESPGIGFDGAFDWFRTAAVYAERRSYRTLAIGEAALSRRERIIADAAAMLQEHADEMNAIVPARPRRRTCRAEYRTAYRKAATTAARLNAARVWFMLMAAQAQRHCRDNDAAGKAAAVKDEATARLIEWAEEMDADDYGER